ncbi:MAG: amidohydrolase family protein, partial [Candidatus Tectomicrobia bacterium]|nr:amidohydrolase family protein [Candidatus Tectomicrobia bacterium]
IVDGTGIPKYRADLAIKNGRIAKISGRIMAGGAQELDATGCIVAPGAVDLHTHYDAQLNWDPYASLSGWFGVTSISIGQCGFGFAPTRPTDRDLNMRMMNRIEAIPLRSMELGMRWDWVTFPEFLDSLDRQGLGVNVGALVPFSPLRGYVLGMLEARHRTSVTEAELNQMKQILYEAMQAGAFGFSADKNLEDRSEDGSALPSHVASPEEFLALSEVVAQFGIGHIGWTIGISDQREEQHALLTEMMVRSGRPLHVAVGDDEDGYQWAAQARSEGLPVVIQQNSMDLVAEFTLAEYNLFDYMPNWIQPLVGTPQERAAKLRDPALREAMKRDVLDRPHSRTNWSMMQVAQATQERNLKYEGMSIETIAQAQGKHPLDAFLDLALDEELQMMFTHAVTYRGDEKLAQRITNPFSHISLSDGGAHVRYLTASMWPVHFLTHWIRDKNLMTLEQAHYKMSAYPAWIADYKDRGTLRLGAWGDIMIYDLDKLGYVHDRPIYANDFPGNERRFVQKPKGLRYVLVNGGVTFQENQCTGALPGKLLRSYEMVS